MSRDGAVEVCLLFHIEKRKHYGGGEANGIRVYTIILLSIHIYIYIYLCAAIRYIVDMSAVHTFVYYNILHNMGVLRVVNEDDEEEEKKDPKIFRRRKRIKPPPRRRYHYLLLHLCTRFTVYL